VTLPSAKSRRRWTIIGLLNAGMIIAYVSRSNLPVALTLPDFIQSFHLSDVDRGTLNSAFFWAYAALQIPAGWVVDRYGVKWPYALSFLFWCLASAGTVFTRSVAQLTALRVILGVGESVVAPASYKWIRFNFAEKERGLAIGLYMAGTKIGPAIGPPLACVVNRAIRVAHDVPDSRAGRSGLAGSLDRACPKRCPSAGEG
jgi:MFS transporter, ACS family, D-galactonate transporter